MGRKRLGELFLERGVITAQQLGEGLTYQRETGHRLGSALVALGFLSEETLCAALGQELGLPVAVVPAAPFGDADRAAIAAVRGRFCEANDLFPLRIVMEGETRILMVAMADPLNQPAIEEMEFTTGLSVRPAIAPLSSIREAVRGCYPKKSGASERVAPPALETPTGDGVGSVRTDEAAERAHLEALIDSRMQRRARHRRGGASVGLDFLLGVREDSNEAVEVLERKFWALLRLMAKKGLITKEEFLQEFEE